MIRHNWLLCLVSLILAVVSPGWAARAEISSVPYPSGDLKVFRDDLTSSSFRITLQNLALRDEPNNRSRVQSWLIAGVRGKPPSYEIEAASYVLLKDGKVTSRTLAVPEGQQQNLVKIADIGLYRQFWTYSVQFSIVSPIEGGAFWVVDTAQIKFNIGTPDITPKPEFVSRFAGEENGSLAARQLLLNPNVDPGYFVEDYADPVDTWSRWADKGKAMAKSGALLRLRLHSGGIYRVTTADVAQVTSSPVSPVSNWRLYKGGQEIGLLLNPKLKDSVFIPVQHKANDGFYEDVYWLDCGGAPADNSQPLRLQPVERANKNANDHEITTATFSVVHRELKDYNPKFRASVTMDKWVWDNVYSESASHFSVNMPEFYSPEPGATTEVTFTYGFANFPSMVPQLLVFINGDKAGETTLTMQQGTAALRVESKMLKPGKNEASLILAYPPNMVQKREISLQSIRTEWDQKLPKDLDGTFTFKAGTITTDTHALTFPRDVSPTLVTMAYDLDQPIILPRDGYKFYTHLSGLHEYMSANLASCPAPESIELVIDIPSMTEIKSERSVIIAHPSLLEGATSLSAQQKSRGIPSVLYTTQQLYDVFAYGKPNPDAIRSAIRYCFNRANGSVPEFITLVGEASDYSGDLSSAPSTIQENLLPASSSNILEAPQGDQLYAAAIGSDQLVDFNVGRIPAATDEQVRDYVVKVNKYISRRPDSAQWAERVEFVMDDNDEFPEVVGRITANSLTPSMDLALLRQWDFEYVPNLRVQGKKRSWGATHELINNFNRGIGVLNFFGHGGPNLWSHERMLHLSDLPAIHNDNRLPLITCASCDNAWITYPLAPVKASMGEQMVLKPDGGAIGLFGPVAGASPYEHSTLVSALMVAISRQQIEHVGELIAFAKNSYYSVTRSASIMDQYLLLGDPTVSFAFPQTKPGLIAINNLTAGAPANLEVKLADYVPDLTSSGTLIVSLSHAPDAPLAQVTVAARERQWQLPVAATHESGAILLVLKPNEPGGFDRRGVIGYMGPQQVPEGPAPKVMAAEGDSYTISPVGNVIINDNSGSSNFKYRLKVDEGASTSVLVSSTLSGGGTLSEPVRVDLVGDEREAEFEINSSSEFTDSYANVTLGVSPLDSIDQNPVSTTTIEYQVDKPSDLLFLPDTAKVYSSGGPLTANTSVFLSAKLINAGDSPARHIVVQALQNDPTTGTELHTINESTTQRIEELAAGAKTTVTFRWETATPGKHSQVYLTTNRNKGVKESDYTNNSILLPEFEVAPLQNYSIFGYELDRGVVVPGTTVSASVVSRKENGTSTHPVLLELGWVRTFDNETSTTKFPVHVNEEFSTTVHVLTVPEGFNKFFAKVNSDFEVEESNSMDNTVYSGNVIASSLPKNTKKIDLSTYVGWGNVSNLLPLTEGKLMVAPELTSATSLLVLNRSDVTTGSVSDLFADDDNQWGVAPWRVASSSSESPGEISLSAVVGGVTDTSGKLFGFFTEGQPQAPPVEVRAAGSDSWTPAKYSHEGGNRFIYELGDLTVTSSTVFWDMKPAEGRKVELNYLRFYPQTIEWESPPFTAASLPADKPVEFTVDTNDQTLWGKVVLQYRNGTVGESGDVAWTDWTSDSSGFKLRFKPESFFQLRIVGEPVPDSKPSLYNFRLNTQ